jgi:hypothetical protein
MCSNSMRCFACTSRCYLKKSSLGYQSRQLFSLLACATFFTIPQSFTSFGQSTTSKGKLGWQWSSQHCYREHLHPKVLVTPRARVGKLRGSHIEGLTVRYAEGQIHRCSLQIQSGIMGMRIWTDFCPYLRPTSARNKDRRVTTLASIGTQEPVRLCQFSRYTIARFTKGSGKKATIQKHQSLYILRSNFCSSSPMALAAVMSSMPPEHTGSNASNQLPAKKPKGMYLAAISQLWYVDGQGKHAGSRTLR